MSRTPAPFAPLLLGLLLVATDAPAGQKSSATKKADPSISKKETSGTKETPVGDPSRWCAPELDALRENACVAGTSPDGGPATLVIFLHGVIPPKTTWQWTQQRAVANTLKILPFVALMPRGLQGVGPEGMKDFFAWPTSQTAQREVEKDLLEELASERKELETRQGRPFDEVFVVGFSSGAYYASSLALRGVPAFDGYGILTGGAKSHLPAAGIPRQPIFLGIATKDNTTRDMARDFGRALDGWHWPHRVHEESMGHMFSPDLVARSIRYLRSAHAAK